MIILQNRLKRLLRSKLTLMLILALPPLMISLIFGLGQSGSAAVFVGLVDQDRTEMTQQLEEVLGEHASVKKLEEADVQGEMAAGRIELALVAEAGFSEDIFGGREPRIYSISIQDSNLSIPLRMTAESFIRAARNLAVAAEGDEDVFYRSLVEYRQGALQLEVSQTSGADRNLSDLAIGSMGILGLNMLFLALHATMHILKDRENRTFYRVMTSPLPQWSYMLQSILCFLSVLLVQIAGVFLISRHWLDIYLGNNVKALFGVMAVFAVVCVAFGIAVAALTKSTRQAGTTASLLVTPMAMLGGMLWPREIMPEVLQRIGLFLPTTWMMKAASKVVESGRFLEAGWEIAILLLFALVFFLLGSWRRADLVA